MSSTQLSLTPETLAESGSWAFCTTVIPPLDGEFIYRYPISTHDHLAVGDVIDVPLGRRTSIAFITSCNSEKERKTAQEMESRGVSIRTIAQHAPNQRGFNPEHLAFYEWVARYYAEPLSKILDLAIPAPAVTKPQLRYRLSGVSSSSTQNELSLGPVQTRVTEFLKNTQEPALASTLKSKCGASSATVRSLLQKNLIEQVLMANIDAPFAPPDLTTVIPPALNEEQQQAVASITGLAQGFSATLLQGVTGSGKTEIYLTLILEALTKGLSALVIVPEIALTPQLTERFVSRLQLPVAVLHSSLKPKERWRHWSDLVSGRVRVAIGARSAIFAPLNDLGIIVVDEEHDSSFKQGEGIRYHARDLALVRGKLSSCPVILGSATPSLESYNNARTGKYLHVHLRQKYHDAAQSTFEIVDLNKIKPWEMKSKSISPAFFLGLQKTLAKGGQAFVLYNKRGFASYLQCSSCEHVVGCPHCSVTLTYHRNAHSLICHQCSFTMVPPTICISCGAHDSLDPGAEQLFVQRGSGTERVHEELGQLFSRARIAVLDRDTASSVQDYVEILRRVREREVDILVGTQMIAKGHDLPGVTFVGIVDSDVGLHIPDFRAAERSFQLLTQVAGRAGRRSDQGHVILQTRVPSHPSLLLTASARYEEFAEHELGMRRELHYPPFHKLLRVIVSAPDRSVALNRAAELARAASTIGEQLTMQVLGPAPAPIEKIRTLWRYHIIMRSPSIAGLQHAMKQLKRTYQSKDETRIAYDLDPHDML